MQVRVKHEANNEDQVEDVRCVKPHFFGWLFLIPLSQQVEGLAVPHQFPLRASEGLQTLGTFQPPLDSDDHAGTDCPGLMLTCIPALEALVHPFPVVFQPQIARLEPNLLTVLACDCLPPSKPGQTIVN
jgi:hypothetical protein